MNNVAKYKACIIRLQVAIEMGQISQKGNLSKALIPYQAHLVEFNKHFIHITYTYLSGKDNQSIDGLAKIIQ